MHRLRNVMPAYLFLLPSCLLFAAFMYAPIVKGLQMSFQSWTFDGHEWVGLDNFRKVFGDPVFWRSMRVTVLFTVVTVAAGLFVSLLAAFMIDPFREKVQTFFKAALYLPSVAPIVIVSILWIWMYHPAFGLFNYLLGKVGLGPVLWLGDPGVALVSIMLMTVAVSQGSNILILVTALGGIPKDYQEAGRIDGAGIWQEIVRIKLPMLKPTLTYLIVVNTVASFQVFAPVYMLTSGGPDRATTTIGFLIYENAFKNFDFGVASAQSIVLLIVVMAIAVVQFRLLASDLEY
ncbi:carbohydrate ABC transporter permease [Paenibacillus contaminans]|uniref:Sugar ABC transporter permease n=1 Tax=Paenibacillus contaminans TaxID=450362 RepID=A0A329MRB9_9BACL|nr:sugar ABC transporter permease [Paenibacillus contaminans]RAV22519.1 sugar ABC transporter permease [Paenibacillus contaminans]